MNVGIYFDLRNAPPWPQDAARLYGFTLELCEEAEHLGTHSVWLSEHHLFDDGYLPQPLTVRRRSRGAHAQRASAPPSCSRRCTIRSRSPNRLQWSTS